jgi:hypothetical protein
MGKKDKNKAAAPEEATPAVENAPASTVDPKLAVYAEKEPTDLQVRFAQWIEAKTGYKPDLRTVALAVFLRIPFQASPENQAVLNERKAKHEAKAAKKGKKGKDQAAPAGTEPTEAALSTDSATTDTPATGIKKGKKDKSQPALAAVPAQATDNTTTDTGPVPAAPARRRPAKRAAAATGGKPSAVTAEASF